MLLTAGALSFGYAVFYAVSTWSLAYATDRLGVDRTVMLVCVMAAVAIMGVLTPFAALLGDRYGRRPAVPCRVRGRRWRGCSRWWRCSRPAQPLWMFVGFLGAMLAFISMFAVISAYLPELYEPRVRCTGAAVGYNLGGVLGGALTPIVATALSRGRWAAVGRGAYLTGLGLLSLGCFALLPETRPQAAAHPAPGAESEAAPA